MTHPTTEWFEALSGDKSGLLPPATEKEISTVEQTLNLRIPVQWREFLKCADGGFWGGKRFLLYSAGKGVHPAETIVAANQNRVANSPLLVVGRDASEEFGYRREDLSSAEPLPIFFHFHDSGEVHRVAGSLAEFLEQHAFVRHGGFHKER